MQCKRLIAGSILALFILIIGGFGRTQAAAPTTLPLEIIGPDGYVVSAPITLNNPDRARYLYLKLHRAAYRDASTNEARGAKASVRINSGRWLEIDNISAECLPQEAAYGCLNGAYHTLRLTINLDQFNNSLNSGNNTLRFRFNGHDNITNGYRVLDLNLLDVDGNALLPASDFVYDDPTQWQPPRTTNLDLTRGQALWESATLVDYPGGPTLQASCADCHAADGRDLKYFNYSNWSIIERSKFHGLSQMQAERIASYIRTLDVPAPAQASPWNPPYQPGPGLDSLPVEQWAAGAGLDWVLESDGDMLPYLFPNGVSRNNLRAVMDTDSTLNVRETPIALQLPDWNEWLPTTHPVDIWGDTFTNGYADDSAPQTAYEAVLDEFASGQRDYLLNRPNQYLSRMSRINLNVRRFITLGEDAGSPWRAKASQPLQQAIDARSNGVSERFAREQAKLNIAKWSAVKQWELHQTFALEDVAPQIFPDGNEARGWPSRGQSVHPLAPHIVADGLNQLEYQSLLVGKYQSTSWYQLQMTLNAGMRQKTNVEPQDWPYQLRHVLELSDVSGVEHPLRMIQSLVKGYQARDNGGGAQFNGWQLRITHPWWLYADLRGDTSVMGELAVYEPGLRNRVVNAMLLEFLEYTTTLTDWNECLPNATSVQRWACVDPDGYVPIPYTSGNKYFEFPSNRHADNLYRVIPCFREQGVPESTIDELISWGESIWPDPTLGNGNWHLVNGQPCPEKAAGTPSATKPMIGIGTGLRADYYNGRNFGTLVQSRVDETIDFEWDAENRPNPTLNADNFSVRWRGYIEPKYNGTHTFFITANDGVRLWIDGRQLINEWSGGDHTLSGQVTLRAGVQYDIEIEYQDRTGPANIQLAWQAPALAPEIVPQSQLYPLVLNAEQAIGVPTSVSLASGAVQTWPPSFSVGFILLTLMTGLVLSKRRVK